LTPIYIFGTADTILQFCMQMNYTYSNFESIQNYAWKLRCHAEIARSLRKQRTRPQQ